MATLSVLAEEIKFDILQTVPSMAFLYLTSLANYEVGG